MLLYHSPSDTCFNISLQPVQEEKGFSTHFSHPGCIDLKAALLELSGSLFFGRGNVAN